MHPIYHVLLTLTVLAPLCQPVNGQTVQPGAQTLIERNFQSLAGKQVGLITNASAQVDTTHLIQVLTRAGTVKLRALFGPEHGLRSMVAAGQKVASSVDEATGIQIHSLYGDTRKPTPEMLRGLDVLVFDIQDVGARFYTYITTMGLAMQAAAENNIPFVVLDRPNPMGGTYVSGFVLNETYQSFVGKYPIPIAHGMTVGELARLIKGEKLLSGLGQLALKVIPLKGWKRSMRWPATGLPWQPPSPNLPTVASMLVYPGSALLEGTIVSEGRGTNEPFVQVGAPWAPAEAIARQLDAANLPGLQFRPISFVPQSIPGMAPNPKLEGQQVKGVRLDVIRPDAVQPVEMGIHLLTAFYRNCPDSLRADFFRSDWLAKLAGTSRLEEMIRTHESPEAIISSWEDEVQAFRKHRSRYLLY